MVYILLVQQTHGSFPNHWILPQIPDAFLEGRTVIGSWRFVPNTDRPVYKKDCMCVWRGMDSEMQR